MEENNVLEQPEMPGSNQFGKFKDADSLLKAYNSLEAEFTKRSQRLANLESENNAREQTNERNRLLSEKVENLVNKYEGLRPFAGALKDTLSMDETQDLNELALSKIMSQYKSNENIINDDEFLNNYVYNNDKIRDKILTDYMSKITQSSPIKASLGAQTIMLSRPDRPTNISEAGKLAKSIIKEK